MEKWSLLLDGAQLLVFGMGMVLAFLVIMILLMNLLAKVLKPFAAKFDALKAPAASAAAPAPAASAEDANLAAVAAAVVSKFRNK
ncbi:MAG: OadG family protein [Lentisphaeria bacterium]|nr:OadG family protein [Lentisphaeria bacterium]